MKQSSNIRSRYMYKYALNIFDFHFRMKVLQCVLFVIMIVLAIFGSVVHAGDKQEGENCKSSNDCAEGLFCKKIGTRNAVVAMECRKS